MTRMLFRYRLAQLFAPDIFREIALAFPEFGDSPALVTPERIRRVGNAHLAMIMDNGPTEIDFCDQEGETRRIVYDAGEWEAGIPAGWGIEGDWAALDEGKLMGLYDALAYARPIVERWCHTQGDNADFFAETLAPIDAALGRDTTKEHGS